MKYMLLIYASEAEMPETPSDPAALEAYMAPWIDYTQSLRDAGVMIDGEPLQPSTTATTVTLAGGLSEPAITDGPFAETKEQLGGFYKVECKDLDEALAWAAKCPGAQFGKIEVRPVEVFD